MIWSYKCIVVMHFSLKIWHLVAYKLTNFPRINRPRCVNHRCKKRFLTFLTFFYFANVCYLKNGKIQSGKQINKKHFQNNSNEIDLWLFCCISNDLKCLPINFYLLTVFDACLNGIFRVTLKAFLGHQAWSWTTLRRLTFFITFTNVLFYFLSLFLRF